jgi:hypothetical protein
MLPKIRATRGIEGFKIVSVMENIVKIPISPRLSYKIKFIYAQNSS